jgi:tetratricopeptide (TPR) repeat protein
MRLLFSTGSAPQYMAPPPLAEEQVNCGPVFGDVQCGGRFVSLATPTGEYDLAAVAARLPADQQPDAVACLVDASRLNLPRNLSALRCPKILLVADTHHLASPLLTLLRYAATERYDRVVLLYDRHHAAFFRTAGVSQLYWFPGLTFPHDDAAVAAASVPAPRRPEIAFVGQTGRHHPRRARLLDALTEAGLPVCQRQLGQREALSLYGGSLLGFNASLNGDLNLRVLEVLAAGGLLVTDRLAPDSGLDELLVDGRECVLYGSPAELVEKAAHHLAHPAAAAALAAAGAAWFRRTLGAERRRAMFQALALDGAAPGPFPLPGDRSRIFRFTTGQQFLLATRTYEEWQERHRVEENVVIPEPPVLSAGLAAMAATLPRLTLVPAVATETPVALAQAARARLDAGDAVTALELARRAFAADPESVPAMAVLGELALRQDNVALAAKLLERAQRLAPANAGVASAATRLGGLLRRQGRLLEGLHWQRRALGAAAPFEPLDPSARPVRVAFLVQHPQGWTSLESVWRVLREDPRFEVRLIAARYDHPYPTDGGPEAIFGFLARLGVPHERWEQANLGPGFADILFLQNPYDVTRPAPLRVPNLARWVSRLAYVPYGLEIGGGERNNTMVMNLPLQQLAWLVCARSERQRQAYARHCEGGNAHVAVTGHAKLDALRVPPAGDPAGFGAFAAGRRLVGWNPHFDIRPKAGSPWGEGFSTFTRWWEPMLAAFAARPDLALVIRPHPLLFGTLESRRIWSSSQVQEFHRAVQAAGNVRFDREGSYLPLFARAEAMISDASSFLLEYAATGRPLLYLHNPDGPGLNEDGGFVRDHLDWAEQETDLAAFLDNVAAGRDPRGDARRRAYPEYMHQPPGGAGAAVRDAILTRLAAEPVALQPESAAVA